MHVNTKDAFCDFSPRSSLRDKWQISFLSLYFLSDLLIFLGLSQIISYHELSNVNLMKCQFLITSFCNVFLQMFDICLFLNTKTNSLETYYVISEHFEFAVFFLYFI